METAFKQHVHTLVDNLPAEATVEDLMRELHELRSLERAFADIQAGRLTPHDEAKRIIMQGFRDK